MSSTPDPQPVPSHWEAPASDRDPIPVELLDGLPRYRCSEDGTRVYSLADVAAHDEAFHAKTDGAAGFPSPDETMLRREALELAVQSQRGVESGPEIVVRAEALLGFLRGEAPSRAAQEDVAWKAAQS